MLKTHSFFGVHKTQHFYTRDINIQDMIKYILYKNDACSPGVCLHELRV